MNSQNPLSIRRRSLLALLGSAPLTGWLGACASGPAGDALPPIVFVHGNGDSSALWTTTLWRWQSNGWPRERLHAVDFPYPNSRDDDTVPQEGRSSAADATRYLAAEVDKVLAATGARQVVLMGNSRGGNAIRSYIAYAGGAAKVSHAILGGTPNHGVWADPAFRPNNEFNGAGPFLTRLNTQQGTGADETTPGPRWMTLRSDNNDKFAQPDGVWIGTPGRATNVTFDGPALRGANNVVLPSRDHRETSYHPQAFAAAFLFVTGRQPVTAGPLHITPESGVVLSGKVTGVTAAGPTNLPAPGGRVAVYAVDPATGSRRGAALFDGPTAANGTWGPIRTDNQTPLEFVVQATGFAESHVYRSPFPRSSDLVHFRPERLADADKGAAAVVSFVRPRAYFGLPRDTIRLDGAPAPGIPPGVAGVAVSKLKLDKIDPAGGRAVVGEFSSGVVSERIVGRLWPTGANQLTVLELHE
jgi:pimeloyl-ACP methyl ester carboxylesterase